MNVALTADVHTTFPNVSAISLKGHFVRPPDAAIITEAKAIGDRFKGLCKTLKLQEDADPYVIALAKVAGLSVVTEEGNKRDGIPDVCNRLGIRCITFSMVIRELGWRF